jgi:hypothetical protein
MRVLRQWHQATQKVGDTVLWRKRHKTSAERAQPVLRVLVAILLYGVVTSTIAAAKSHKPKQEAPAAQQQPAPEQRGTEQAPLVIKIENPNQAKDETSPDGTKRPNKGGDGWFADWSLSDRIAGIASAAAFLQFLALIATIWVMVTNGRRQLRAYLFLESANITDGTTVDPPMPAFANVPGVAAQIRNSGQTPAYRVLTWAAIDVAEPINEERLVVPALQLISPTNLGANGTLPKFVRFTRALSADEIADVRVGRRQIYFYGRLENRDAFGRKKFTNFRLQYVGDWPPPKGAVLVFCNNGNDAN